jgi:hypothetical protein
MGVSISSAVLQRAYTKGMGDSGGACANYGSHPQLFKRGGVVRGFEVGGSTWRRVSTSEKPSCMPKLIRYVVQRRQW